MLTKLAQNRLYLLLTIVSALFVVLVVAAFRESTAVSITRTGDCDCDGEGHVVPARCLNSCFFLYEEGMGVVGNVSFCGPPCSWFGSTGSIPTEEDIDDEYTDDPGCFGEFDQACRNALHAEWMIGMIDCCHEWDWEELGCEFDGQSGIDGGDLKEFVLQFDDALSKYNRVTEEGECAHLTREQIFKLICCFMSQCGDQWSGHCGSGDGGPLETVINDILDEDRFQYTAINEDEMEEILESCTDCCATEIMEDGSGTGVYYSSCDGIECDFDGNETVECEDLKQFVEKAKHVNGGELSRSDILTLVCAYMEVCEDDACDFLITCLNEIFEEQLGDDAESLTSEELEQFLDGECAECDISLEDIRGGDAEGGESSDCPEDEQNSNENDNPEDPRPVSMVYGDKIESATDLRVSVTGRDYVLYREYSSNPDYDHPVFIDGWTWSAFEFVEYDDIADTIKVKGHSTQEVVLHGATGSGPWDMPGPNARTMRKASVTIDGDQYPVWRLEEPGRWQKDYFRENDSGENGGSWVTIDSTDKRIGLLLQTRDEYGVPHSYDWVLYGSADVPRLRSIYLNGTPDGISDPDARVEFYWNFDANGPIVGRLMEVHVIRYDSSGDPIITQKIEYDYFGTGFSSGGGIGGGIPLDSPIGSTGDLIQTTKTTKLDLGERIQITQYRYHTGEADNDNDGFTEAGQPHRLKMIIMPEQIEYAAQQNGVTVSAQAMDLLDRSDGYTVFTEDSNAITVNDLAAKIIAKYETSGDERVLTQYIQSACGCGSGSTQGLELTYDYQSYSSGTKWTTKITEKVLNGSTYNLHRTLYYDSEELGPAGQEIPYLINRAIVDGSNEWVVRYEYDAARNVTKMFTPAAISNYTPSTGSGPTLTYNDDGLVYRHVYTSDNRLTETYVRQDKVSPVEYLVSKITYGSGIGSEREHLPKKIERFRVEGSSAANDVETTEIIYGFHTSGEDDIAWTEMKVEAELEAENGPGGHYLSYELYDSDGNNTYSIAADDCITKREFDDATARVSKIIRNASNDLGSSYHGLTTSGFGRNSDGDSLTTEYVRDALGRVIERISPGLVSTYTVRAMQFWSERPNQIYYAEVTLPHQIDAGNDIYDGPGTSTIYNADNDVIGTYDFTIDENGYDFSSSVLVGWHQGDDLSKSSIKHDVSGLVKAQTVWHDIANDESYETTYEYDELGRVSVAVDPLGTHTRNTYDVLDRVTKVEVGTDSGPSGNMLDVMGYEYDDNGIGNSLLTETTQHVDGSTTRVSTLEYDWRDRLIKTTNPLPPNRFIVYDNLDRVVEEAVFETTGTNWTNLTDIDDSARRAERGLYKRTKYSQRGLAYTQEIAIDPNVAVASMTFLGTNRWFDQVGRTIGSWSPNGPMSKTTFDGLGRPDVSYITNRGSDADPGASGNHADVYDASNFEADVTGDVVLEERHYNYIDGGTPAAHAGMVDLVTSYRRAHTASTSTTGELSAAASANSIVTFTGTFFDGADRVIRSVNYGTNQTGFEHGGTAPTLNQSSPPDWDTSGDELVSETLYNNRGMVEQVTDPDGQVTKYFYDDLNRSVATIENFDDATVAWDATSECWEVDNIDDAEPDTDRVTSFVFDGNNNVTKQVAHRPDSSDNDDPQITKYEYGVTNSGESKINHNGLLFKVTYPDATPNEVEYGYNRLGETRFMEDQNGSTHTYTRDGLGRVTKDAAVKGAGSDIDDTIDSIEMAYDDLGRVTTITSNDASTVVNQILFEYTKLWQIENVWQEVDDEVDDDPMTGSPKVSYTYDNDQVADGNHSRMNLITYPNGESYQYEYTGTVNNSISRLTSIRPGGIGIGSPDVAYQYIGLGMVATVDLGIPDVQLDYQVQHNGERNDGEYAGFDRFGRVIHHPWVDGDFDEHASLGGVPNIPPIVELTYAYDKASNRLNMLDGRPGVDYDNRDMVYTYDGLDRLQEAKRGVDGGSFAHAPGSEKWSLDMLGNWATFETDLTGDGDYADTNETTNRDHNDVNELIGLDLDDNSTFELVPTYDDAGNMREHPINSNTKYRYTHDLWNRLVKVEIEKAGSWFDVAEYEYFGTHWRSIKRVDTDEDFAFDEQREMYYTAGWQLIEERIDDDYINNPGGGTGVPPVERTVQYLWGGRYIDDIIMHREDGNGDGDFIDTNDDSTSWHLTDVQFSTIAILDDAANLQERVKYDSYGRALHHDWRDVDGDRDYDSTDRSAIATIAISLGNQIGDPAYLSEADLDRDGTIDSNDLNLATTNYNAALSSGTLSNSDVKNQIGWDGYVYNSEIASAGLYTVRFRWYSPDAGRWLERDPAGYVDELSLYQFLGGRVFRSLDPLGLFDEDCPASCPNRLGPTNDPIWSLPPCWYDHRFGLAFHWDYLDRISEAFKDSMAKAAVQVCEQLKDALKLLNSDCQWEQFKKTKYPWFTPADPTKPSMVPGRLAPGGYTREELIEFIKHLLDNECSGKKPFRFQGDPCPGCESGSNEHDDPHEPGFLDDDTHFPINNRGDLCPQLLKRSDDILSKTILHEYLHIYLDVDDAMDDPRSAHYGEAIIPEMADFFNRRGYYSHIEDCCQSEDSND